VQRVVFAGKRVAQAAVSSAADRLSPLPLACSGNRGFTKTEWGSLVASLTLSRISEQSESWMDCAEYTGDMRVSFGLLTDSQDDGASPWDVVAIVLQVVGAMDRLRMEVAEGGSKRPPLGRGAADEVLAFAPEFSRSRVLIQHGVGIDRQTIVACVIGEKSHPRLGLALILLQAQE